jgi:hypothetical protein
LNTTGQNNQSENNSNCNVIHQWRDVLHEELKCSPSRCSNPLAVIRALYLTLAFFFITQIGDNTFATAETSHSSTGSIPLLSIIVLRAVVWVWVRSSVMLFGMTSCLGAAFDSL